jgi:hypothetical protein
MIKWILWFVVALFVVSFMLDSFAQTQSIILGPNNEIVGQIVTYPPIPQWR